MLGTTLGANTGGVGCDDVPQVTNYGRKMGAGIGARENILHCVLGAEVGTDVGIGDYVGRVEGVMGGSTLRGVAWWG